MLIAVFLGRLGWHHLEQVRSRGDFLKQFASALLMVAALVLYCWEDLTG